MKNIYIVSEEQIVKDGVVYHTAETLFRKKENAEQYAEKHNGHIRSYQFYD